MKETIEGRACPDAGFNVIQQWQYAAKLHPDLLLDEVLERLSDIGITSLQSYVTWAEIEKNPGVLDFSTYDALVEKIAAHQLKWVPFLILGPHYATPRWFQLSKYSCYAKCLEHGRESRIQSIWNPALPAAVHRFVRRFSEHYTDETLFEAVLLGISGNWGESIYPATGGFRGGFHTHPGLWCADAHALRDYRQYLRKKYASPQRLNLKWATAFTDFSQIPYPRVKSSLPRELFFLLTGALPFPAKRALADLKSHLKRRLGEPVAQSMMKKRLGRRDDRPPHDVHRWLDFIQWYRQSMTAWAEFWLRTARTCFPQSDLYLVTGGSGAPFLGADFAAQARMASRYRAGIRITNQNDNFAESFILSRLSASACRNYGTYFTTEEAGVNRPSGVSMRLFDAVTSGARGAYFKALVTNSLACGAHRAGRLGLPTRGARILKDNRFFLKPGSPQIEAAILYPGTTFAIEPKLLPHFHGLCSAIRAGFDFDLVDETMIADGILCRYRFTLILNNWWLPASVLSKLKDYVAGGGILIALCRRIGCVAGSENGRNRWLDLSKERIFDLGKGLVLVKHPGTEKTADLLTTILDNESGAYPWEKLVRPAPSASGTYAVRMAEADVHYNPRTGNIIASAPNENVRDRSRRGVIRPGCTIQDRP